jgi:hypothetical protein
MSESRGPHVRVLCTSRPNEKQAVWSRALFTSLHVLSPWMFYVPPCFISFHASYPHISRPIMFYLSERFKSIRVLPLCMYQIHSCSISLHVSNPFVFYLSTCFRSLHISSLCMFHIPSCFMFSMFQFPPRFISLHVSNPFVFYLSTCFISLHILSLCMFLFPLCFISLHVSLPFMFYLSTRFRSLHIFILLHVSHPFMFHISDPSIFYLCILQIPTRVIFRHVSDPFIFHLSACFTPLQVLGDRRVPCRPVLRCSRFDALLEMCVNISVILEVTCTNVSNAVPYTHLKMAAVRSSETLALIYQYKFSYFRGWYWSKDSSGFWHRVHTESEANVSCLQCYSVVIQLPFRSRQHAAPTLHTMVIPDQHSE